MSLASSDLSIGIGIVVRFYPKPELKDEFRQALYDLIDEMSKEPTFINSIMYQDIDNLDALLHYETWAESKESFYENQWDKPYRQEYEKPGFGTLCQTTRDYLIGYRNRISQRRRASNKEKTRRRGGHSNGALHYNQKVILPQRLCGL